MWCNARNFTPSSLQSQVYNQHVQCMSVMHTANNHTSLPRHPIPPQPPKAMLGLARFNTQLCAESPHSQLLFSPVSKPFRSFGAKLALEAVHDLTLLFLLCNKTSLSLLTVSGFICKIQIKFCSHIDRVCMWIDIRIRSFNSNYCTWHCTHMNKIIHWEWI